LLFETLNPEDLLSRPAATLSSIWNGGEGRGEEALWFMGRECLFEAVVTMKSASKSGVHFAKAGKWLPALGTMN